MLPKSLKYAVLALTVAELAVFIALASQIGVVATIGLMLATALLGFVLLKIAGRRALARMHAALATRRIEEAEVTGAGFFTMLAGVLLILPGFLTDIGALLLLVPPVQRRLTAALGRVLYNKKRDSGVLDLEPGEWNRVEEAEPARLRDHPET